MLMDLQVCAVFYEEVKLYNRKFIYSENDKQVSTEKKENK